MHSADLNLSIKNLEVSLDNKKVINDLSIDFVPHKVTAIIGPNGSGKSTLLKAIAGLVKPTKGHLTLNGQQLTKLRPPQLAKLITFLMQNPQVADDLTVFELASFGRYCHHGWRGLGKIDKDKIVWAIEQVALTDLSGQPLSRMSGGQRQRAWLAMALAQDTPLIMLDEPTSFLDIRHQLEILLLLQKLNIQQHKTIIMVLHDIQQALQFADYIAVIEQGSLVYHQQVAAINNLQVFEQVFGVSITAYPGSTTAQHIAINALIK